MILSTPFADLPMIGPLEVVDVFAYHDGPRLFSAKNSIGGLFLVEWAARDDSEDVWLVGPLSPARYRAIAVGEIAFRSAFTHSELGFVYQARVSRGSGEASVSLLPSNGILERLLPAEGERVDEDEARFLSTTAHLVGLDQSITNVPSLDLRIQPSDDDGGIIALRDIADLLLRFQQLSDTVFKTLAGKAKRQRSKLGIAQAYAGSLGFIIRGISDGSSSVTGPTSLILPQIANLIDAAIKQRRDLHLSPDSLRKVTGILDWFVKRGTEATLSVIAIPELRGFSTRITPDQGREAVDFLRRQDSPFVIDGQRRLATSAESLVPDTTGAALVKGRFLSLDTINKTYEFQGENRMVFSGVVTENAMEAARHITFGLDYSVRIVRDITSGASPMNWLLLEIIPNVRQLA